MGAGRTEAQKITTEMAPTPITVYDLYEKYTKPPSEGGVLSERTLRPKEGTHVPGTLKRSGDRYYCIALEQRDAYYNFCKKLFTKGADRLIGDGVSAKSSCFTCCTDISLGPAISANFLSTVFTAGTLALKRGTLSWRVNSWDSESPL